MADPTTKRFARTVAVLAGLSLAVVTLPASAARPPAICPTALGCGTDLSWALDLENKITENMWYGQVFEVDHDPATGAITNVNHFGDSALWTGTYLASQSFRYSLASNYLKQKKIKKDDRDFWIAQQLDAKSRVDAMVAKYHLLVNISKNWTNTSDPTVAPPQVNLGGAVYKGGEPGYLMRACIPTDAPEWQRWSNNEISKSRRIYGPLVWDDGKQYWCEDATSRDAYAGAIFGLLTAFDFVSGDDPAMRTQLRDDFVTLAAFAVKYYWSTPRPNGRISIPIGSNHDGAPCTSINPTLDICGHDFENFISPLFVAQPIARLNIASGAHHVVHAAPGRDDVAKWDGVWAEELAADLPSLSTEMEVDDFQPNQSYYKFNLNQLTTFDVTRLETDPAVHAVVKQAYGVMDSTTGDDINAHFETLTYAATGEVSRRDAAVTHIRQWRDYYTRIHTTPTTDNKVNCGATIECVPDDQLDITQSGQTVTIPGTSPNKRARGPLPVANRPPTDFLWQRPPTQLNGSESIYHQAPGIDYLLPYWMLRYYSEAAPPPLEPFPAWPGPVHS